MKSKIIFSLIFGGFAIFYIGSFLYLVNYPRDQHDTIAAGFMVLFTPLLAVMCATAIVDVFKS